MTSLRLSGLGIAATALLAGWGVQIGWVAFAGGFLSRLGGGPLAAFGRSPEELLSWALPFLSAAIATCFHRRGWWYLGLLCGFPTFFGSHTLFAGDALLAQGRLPTLHDEHRFVLQEGHRLLAGLLGAYGSALLAGRE